MSTPNPPGPWPAPTPPTGAVAWGLGLAILLCLPVVGSVLAGGLMVAAGLSMRRQGPLAEANGCRAANWGLTYAVFTVLALSLHFGLLWLLTRDGDSIEGFFPFGIILTSWLVVTVVHLVISLFGMLRAAGGHRVPQLGVPVFRPRAR